MTSVYKKVTSTVSFNRGKPVLNVIVRNAYNRRLVVPIENLSCDFFIPHDKKIEKEDEKNILGRYHGYFDIFGNKVDKVKVAKISDVRRLGNLYGGLESDVHWDQKKLLDMKLTGKFGYEDGEIVNLDKRFNGEQNKEVRIDNCEGFSAESVILKKDISINEEDASDEVRECIIPSWDGELAKFNLPGFSNRVCVVDIEVIAKTKEDLSNYNGEIICIVMWDNYTNSYMKLSNDFGEKDLLIDFWKKFSNCEFDIISGWNVDFDIKWIMERSLKYDIDFEQFVKEGKSFLKKYQNKMGTYTVEPVIAGKIILDGMDLYKKKTQTTEKLNSYSLKSVALVEGLDPWEDLGSNMAAEWEKDKEKVIEYCRKDVENTMRIIYKNELIKGAEIISNISGCKLSDVLSNSKVIDSMLFLYKGNYVLPNIRYDVKDKNIIGAKVLMSKMGIHKNVGIFDAASLYPSIIGGFNISSEMLITKLDKVMKERGKIIKIDVGKNSYYFYKKNYKLGLIPEIVSELRKYRESIRERRTEATKVGDDNLFKLLNDEEKVTKGLLASLYGVLGYSYFRLYNEDCANCITGIARNIIEEITGKLKDTSCDIIYGDTDSIFIQMPDYKYGFKIMDDINGIIFNYVKAVGLEEKVIVVNYEKFFRWIFFKRKKVAIKQEEDEYFRGRSRLASKVRRGPTSKYEAVKKQYVGFISHVQSGNREMKEVNELYNKGYELRRSDSAKALKKVQLEFFNRMENGDYDRSIKYLREVKKTFHTYEIDDIAMPRSVNDENANNPWADGVRYSKLHLNFEFNENELPKLIYVRSTGKYPYTKVLCYNNHHVIPKDFQIDYNVMFEKLIKRKFQDIIETLGLKWEIYVEGQQKLDLYC